MCDYDAGLFANPSLLEVLEDGLYSRLETEGMFSFLEEL